MLFEDEFGDLDDEDIFGDEHNITKDLGDYNIYKSITYDHDSDWDSVVIALTYYNNFIFAVERCERYYTHYDYFDYIPDKSNGTPMGPFSTPRETAQGRWLRECRNTLFEILQDIVDDKIIVNTDDILNDLVFLMRDRGVEIRDLRLDV